MLQLEGCQKTPPRGEQRAGGRKAPEALSHARVVVSKGVCRHSLSPSYWKKRYKLPAPYLLRWAVIVYVSMRFLNPLPGAHLAVMLGKGYQRAPCSTGRSKRCRINSELQRGQWKAPVTSPHIQAVTGCHGEGAVPETSCPAVSPPHREGSHTWAGLWPTAPSTLSPAPSPS